MLNVMNADAMGQIAPPAPKPEPAGMAVSNPAYTVPPSRMRDLKPDFLGFTLFLSRKGAELLAPKGSAIIRFRTDRGIGTVHHGPLRLLWWSMEAEKAWASYKNTAVRWRGSRHTGRLLPDEKRRRDTLNALAHRDGARCVYCWVALSTKDATLEHFIPLNSGGSNSLSNLGLACAPCNSAMSHKPIAQKIAIATRGSFR